MYIHHENRSLNQSLTLMRSANKFCCRQGGKEEGREGGWVSEMEREGGSCHPPCYMARILLYSEASSHLTNQEWEQ